MRIIKILYFTKEYCNYSSKAFVIGKMHPSSQKPKLKDSGSQFSNRCQICVSVCVCVCVWLKVKPQSNATLL